MVEKTAVVGEYLGMEGDCFLDVGYIIRSVADDSEERTFGPCNNGVSDVRSHECSKRDGRMHGVETVSPVT